MHNCENDKYYHQMRNKYFQFQRNEQSEIVSELHQCFWGGLSEVWEKTKITLCFTHIQEGWQEFSRKLVTSKIYFEAVTFPAAALRGSPHSSHNQLLLWDEQACLRFPCCVFGVCVFNRNKKARHLSLRVINLVPLSSSNADLWLLFNVASLSDWSARTLWPFGRHQVFSWDAKKTNLNFFVCFLTPTII